MQFMMSGYRNMGKGTLKMLFITGGVFLLFQSMTPGMAWSDENEIFYKKDLVFVEKRRSLVGMSTKYLREADRMKGKSIVETFTIRVWSADSGTVEETLRFSPKEEPRSIDGSRAGDCLVATFWNRPEKEKHGHSSIACYSLTEHKWTWREDWPNEFVDTARRVKFSSDGLKVIATGYKHVVVYDAKTGRKLETIEDPLKDYPLLSMSIRGSVLSPSGRYIVIWQELAPPGHHVWGKWIANKWVTVWDLQTRKEIAKWRKPEYENHCATFTQNEKHILFGSGGGHVRIWSVEKQEIIRDWSLGFLGVVADMKFSDDYQHLAISLAGNEFYIRVYDYSSGKEIHSFGQVGAPAEGDPYPMTFFDKSDFFAFAKRKNQVCVYDTQTWKEKWCYP